jgi:hypothetical protein
MFVSTETKTTRGYVATQQRLHAAARRADARGYWRAARRYRLTAAQLSHQQGR